MDIIKLYSRKSFILIFFFMIVLLQLFNWAFYQGIKLMENTLAIKGSAEASFIDILRLMDQVKLIQYNFKAYFLPVSTVIFILFSLLLWIILRQYFIKLINQYSQELEGKNAE